MFKNPFTYQTIPLLSFSRSLMWKFQTYLKIKKQVKLWWTFIYILKKQISSNFDLGLKQQLSCNSMVGKLLMLFTLACDSFCSVEMHGH